jgi:hypothetical protein
MAAPVPVVGPLLPHVAAAPPQLDESLASLLPGVATDFLWQATRMPRLSRRLLIERVDPHLVAPSELLDELQLSPGLVSLDAPVMHKARFLDAKSCAALRAVVDRERRSKIDTVDGAPDHQLNLSHERLAQLIGSEAVAALWRLPMELLGGAPVDTRTAQVFVRRYTLDTRPWNPFHVDSARVTLNVALSEEASCDGGELLALHEEGVRAVARGEGDATVHSSTLLHAVRRLASGTRYSLIVFIGEAERRLPAELSFDAAAREAEAEALATLVADRALIEVATATLGAGDLDALLASYSCLRANGSSSIGSAVERAVQKYAAPHLRPSSIRQRVGSGQAKGACWSLRALLRYALEDFQEAGAADRLQLAVAH